MAYQSIVSLMNHFKWRQPLQLGQVIFPEPLQLEHLEKNSTLQVHSLCNNYSNIWIRKSNACINQQASSRHLHIWRLILNGYFCFWSYITCDTHYVQNTLSKNNYHTQLIYTHLTLPPKHQEQLVLWVLPLRVTVFLPRPPHDLHFTLKKNGTSYFDGFNKLFDFFFKKRK